MKIKVTKFHYGLELVLKTNSPENWYGWTRECCLSLHDSGPSHWPDASLTTSIFSQQKPEGTPPGYKVSGHKQDERRSWDIYPFSSKWLFSFFSSFSCGTFIVHIYESISDLSISFHWYILPIFISGAELKNNNNCSFGIRPDIITPCLNVHNTSLFLFLKFSYSRFLLHIVLF